MKNNAEELVTKAMGQIIRDPNQVGQEQELLSKIEQLLTDKTTAQIKRKAAQVLASVTRPGSTQPTGNLIFPGMEAYFYEPNRILKDGRGHVIEQDKALSDFKKIEDQRAKKRLKAATACELRTSVEFTLHDKWTREQQVQGRNDHLTYGDFIRETKALQVFPKTDAA